MPRLDIQKARAAGYNDDQIQQFAKQSGVSLYDSSRQTINPTISPPQTQSNPLLSLLPIGGSILGGVLGAPIGGFGAVLGAGAGGAAGETARQLLTGENNPGSIGTEALLGGIGGGFGAGIGSIGSRLLGRGAAEVGAEAAGQVAGKAGRGALARAGQELIGTQYNVPRTTAKAIGFDRGTLDTLARQYGLSKITDVERIAPLVTGENGVITQIQRAAIAKANPVNLGANSLTDAFGVDRPAVLDLAKELSQDPLLSESTGKRFFSVISRGIQKASGGPRGSLGPANPSDVFGFINDLKNTARAVGAGKNPSTLTKEEAALKRAYGLIANELEDRLYIESGGNNAVVNALSPQHYAQLNQISPNLAQQVSQARTIQELKGIAQPFVAANRAADATESGFRFGFKNLGGINLAPSIAGAVGGGALFGIPGAVGGAVLGPVAQSLAESASGNIAPRIGQVLLSSGERGLPKATQAIGRLASQGIGQTAVRGGIPSQNQSQEQLPASDQFSNQSQISQTNNPSPDDAQTRLAFAQAILQNPRQAAAIKAAYDLISGPGGTKISSTTKDRVASLQVGEKAVNDALGSTTKGYGPIGGSISKKLLEGFGGAGVPSDVVRANTRYQLLRQSVVRALQGARMSDTDIALAIQYIPQISDTNNTAQEKLKLLKSFLQETRSFLENTPENSNNNLPTPQDFSGLLGTP